ncbi:MAG: protein kinase [Polyangiaceae bacterium]
MTRVPADLLDRLRDEPELDTRIVESVEGASAAARFELRERIGAGGMGEVHLAIDHLRGCSVAVKLLDAIDEDDYRRFEREASALAELRHPAIVGYVAHGKLGPRAFVAMDWLDGETLAQRFARQGLTVSESVALGRRIASALSHVHELGLVHRDVKPSNIFLLDGEPEMATLIDFGIARRAFAESSLTATGFAIGSVGYMAPEQARGSQWLDARVDVFSLGSVLYKCLTGRRAFRGRDPLAVMAKTVFSEPPRPRSLMPAIPPALDALVMRMLAKDPRERPSDGQAVWLEIGEIGPTDDQDRAPDSGAYPMLGRSERRLASVLVVSAFRSEGGPRPLSGNPAALARWVGAARAHGVKLDTLADGSLIASFGPETAAFDAIVRLARSALSLSALLPRARVVLATARGLSGGGAAPADVVDRAAEILSRQEARREAEAPAITVDRVSAALLSSRFDVATFGGELALIGERGSDFAPTHEGRASRHVGRSRQLDELEAAWADVVRTRSPRASLVVGPAGIGKTRLWQELARRIGAGGAEFAIWSGRADPGRAGAPYGLLSDALARAFGIFRGEPIASVRDKLSSRAAGRRAATPERLRALQAAAEMFHTGGREAELGEPMVSDAERVKLGWLELVSSQVERAPLLLVLDDAEWGDLPSFRLAASVVTRLPHAPVLLVCAGRPTVESLFADVWSELAPQRVEVPPLSKKSRVELITLLAPDELDRTQVARIAEASDGNPYALEELVRTHRADPGAPLPETVLALVDTRLDRLGPDSQAVLRAASVFGMRAWPGALEELVHEVDVEGAIEQLLERELVARAPTSRFPAEPELVFRQSLVREAAYARLTPEDRRLGHRLAAGWLERMGEPEPVTLADHFERGGLPGKAAVHYQRAARQALGGLDFRAAQFRAERALECIAEDTRAGAAPRPRGQIGALHLALAEALRWHGDAPGALVHAERARSLLEVGSEGWLAAMTELVAVLGRLGEYQRVAETLTEVARERLALGARSAQVAALCPGTAQLLQAGHQQRVDALVRAIEEIAERGSLDVAARARLEQLRGFLALRRGEPWLALEHYRAAHEAFDALGNVRQAAVELVNWGHAAIELGSLDEAERALSRAIGIAELVELETVRAVAELNRGRLYLQRGELELALASEIAALELGMREKSPRVTGAARIHLARVALGRGDLVLAEAEAAAAVELLEVAPPLAVGAFATLAEAQLAAGRADDAERSARAAVDCIAPEQHEMFDALAQAVWVKVELALGRRESALSTLRVALRELDARASRVPDPELANAFLQRVSAHAGLRQLARDCDLE